MNLLLRSLCLLALTSGIAISQNADTRNAPDFSPLQGCWETVGDDETTQEYWMAPFNGSMIGMARTIHENHVMGYEFLRLTSSGEHTELTAWPSGQEETTFQLTRYAEGEWVFENPEHDFPKRIVYRISGNTLHASIHAMTLAEDPEDQGRRVDFRYERMACPT